MCADRCPARFRQTSRVFLMAAKGVKGMPDILPVDSPRWNVLEQVAHGVFAGAGLSEIRTPVLESRDVFVRTVGESSDIVRKEMYSLEDGGGRQLVLRPECTASVARAVVEHKLIGSGEELRLWYRGPMFRYERPQKGRQRQFFQLGVEVFGNPDPLLDAEVIGLNVQLLNALGITDFQVKVNSIGDSASRPAYQQALVAYATDNDSVICDDCRQRRQINPLRMLDCKVPDCRKLFADAPKPLDYLDPGSREHFDKVCGGLDTLGVPWELDPSLVRGLDYYTRTVFEITSTALGAQDAISAGGRYDTLIEDFGGSATPAFGFAAGYERLLLAAADAFPEPEPTRPVAWIALDDEARIEGLAVVSALRAAGVPAIHFLHKGSMKAQMRAANNVDAAAVLIRGSDDRQTGVVQLKRMDSGEQVQVAMAPGQILAAVQAD